jgi:uncharacterized protein YndB with AHSA1/START domain
MTDPQLDLSISRVVDVPRAAIWRAWTDPEWLKPWFCPRPWRTIDCEIDLRPGGVFRTTMQSPEGEQFPNIGCYLELIPQRRLVWTNALLPGWRPVPVQANPGSQSATPSFLFTAGIELTDCPEGTLYKAFALHADELACQTHAAMGFELGWGAALDQLVEMVKQRA